MCPELFQQTVWIGKIQNCLHLIWDQPGFQSVKSIIVGSRVPTHLTSKSLGSWVLGVLNPKQCTIKGVHLHSSFQEGPGLVRRMRSKRRSPGWKGRWCTSGPQMKWYCLIKRRVASLYIYIHTHIACTFCSLTCKHIQKLHPKSYHVFNSIEHNRLSSNKNLQHKSYREPDFQGILSIGHHLWILPKDPTKASLLGLPVGMINLR